MFVIDWNNTYHTSAYFPTKLESELELDLYFHLYFSYFTYKHVVSWEVQAVGPFPIFSMILIFLVIQKWTIVAVN